MEHAGRGPHPNRRQESHVHQTLFILSTQYLCACDQSTDYIEIYKADVQSSLLIHRSMLHLYGGPRYLASTNGTLCYLCHELSNEVTVLYMYNDVLCVQQTLSTIPEETVKTVSASRLSQNQQHLYASNRGRGSIAVFNMLPGSLLKAAGHWNAGALPCDFVLLEDDLVLVADQKAGFHLLDQEGAEVDFHAHVGTMCVCC